MTTGAQNKTIMILGAGNVVSPLIRQAKNRGLRIVVVSPPGDYPGFQYADEQVHCDYLDGSMILEKAHELRIDGITSTGTDAVVPVIGRVVDALGLRGTGYEAARVCSHKWEMKRVLQVHGIRVAEGRLCSGFDEVEEAAHQLGFPLMCKAVDSSGSQGIQKVEMLEELAGAWSGSAKVSRTGDVVIEQYLEGLEFGAQAIVEGNTVVAVLFHNDQLTPPPDYTPVGHSMPCQIEEGILEKARHEVVASIEALGIRDAIVNVDLMLVDGSPYIIEIGARMGATCLPESISHYAGFNAYDAVLSLALGEPLRLSLSGPGLANASRLIESRMEGTVKSIRLPDRVAGNEQLVHARLYVQPGDRVKKFQVGPDRIGDVLVQAPTVEEAEQLARQFAAAVELEYG